MHNGRCLSKAGRQTHFSDLNKPKHFFDETIELPGTQRFLSEYSLYINTISKQVLAYIFIIPRKMKYKSN